ncbi:hypothetical protein [Mycolicibacterium brisbanense]|uniref:Uncharacterized protein n=1 Tax=Mycolicibacterium brisbanense TaxID=146020 RepID=A0A100W424_9MYCO|nr:hypothetical protein [Mycolicibacterium brisbanense]MCV7157183.1 hypothetical protein [Mycolicibacterium brisbanense]GAS91255.1 uncharacterized protein RMCB_5351 [Mycolicibacterium brisbanense]
MNRPAWLAIAVAPGIDVLAGIAEIPVRDGCDTRFLGGFAVLGKTLQEVEFKSGTLR